MSKISTSFFVRRMLLLLALLVVQGVPGRAQDEHGRGRGQHGRVQGQHGRPQDVPGRGQGERGRVIYVSDRGDDAADGMNASHPVRSFDKALAIARAAAKPATISMTGRFVLTAPLRLSAADKGLTLVGGIGGQRAQLIAAPDSKVGILVTGADGVTVSNFMLSNFAEDGVFVANAQNVRVQNNIILNTPSPGWSHGAIHYTGNVRGGRIEDNLTNGADYAGIIADTDKNSDISNLQIIGNTVVNSCRKIADCGAIYVDDRGKRSVNITISDNVVHGFGQANTKGRGIYLDDFSSNVTVVNNNIIGPGTFGFQIHGGHDNTIKNNSVDLSNVDQPILYQPENNAQWAEMRNNVLVGNNFTHTESKVLKPAVPRLVTPGDTALHVTSNRWCDSNGCRTVSD